MGVPQSTTLFGRNTPGGVFTISDLGYTTGAVWFVNSASGTNSVGYGYSPDAPFASVDYAMSQVNVSKADRVYVMPGHTETLTAAGTSVGNGGVFIGNTLSAGVQIIGLGTGRLRPTFNYTTAAAASMNIGAANVLLRNLVFTPNGVASVTAAINVTGADFWFDQCEMQISTGTNACVLGILTAATATRFTVTNSRFLGPQVSTQTCTAAIQHESGVDFNISNNLFNFKWTNAILNVATVLQGLIDSNRFVGGNATTAVTLAAATTAFVVNNRFNTGGGTAPVVAAAGFVAGNVYSAAAGVTAGSAITW